MTSAPRSSSTMLHDGPITVWPNSSTRMPESGSPSAGACFEAVVIVFSSFGSMHEIEAIPGRLGRIRPADVAGSVAGFRRARYRVPRRAVAYRRVHVESQRAVISTRYFRIPPSHAGRDDIQRHVFGQPRFEQRSSRTASRSQPYPIVVAHAQTPGCARVYTQFGRVLYLACPCVIAKTGMMISHAAYAGQQYEIEFRIQLRITGSAIVGDRIVAGVLEALRPEFDLPARRFESLLPVFLVTERYFVKSRLAELVEPDAGCLELKVEQLAVAVPSHQFEVQQPALAQLVAQTDCGLNIRPRLAARRQRTLHRGQARAAGIA